MDNLLTFSWPIALQLLCVVGHQACRARPVLRTWSFLLGHLQISWTLWMRECV